MSILDDAKLALRISSAVYDNEITDLIDACRADMALVGLDPLRVVETDKLVKRAIVTFVKANFGLDNPDAERLQASYEQIKASLALAAAYTLFTVTIQTGEQQSVIFDGLSRETNDAGDVEFSVAARDHYEYRVAGAIAYVDVTADVTIDLR